MNSQERNRTVLYELLVTQGPPPTAYELSRSVYGFDATTSGQVSRRRAYVEKSLTALEHGGLVVKWRDMYWSLTKLGRIVAERVKDEHDAAEEASKRRHPSSARTPNDYSEDVLDLPRRVHEDW